MPISTSNVTACIQNTHTSRACSIVSCSIFGSTCVYRQIQNSMCDVLVGHLQSFKSAMAITPDARHTFYNICNQSDKLLTTFSNDNTYQLLRVFFISRQSNLSPQIKTLKSLVLSPRACLTVKQVFSFFTLLLDIHVVFFNVHAEKIMSRCTQE